LRGKWIAAPQTAFGLIGSNSDIDDVGAENNNHQDPDQGDEKGDERCGESDDRQGDLKI
jgi:hypothetical protein